MLDRRNWGDLQGLLIIRSGSVTSTNTWKRFFSLVNMSIWCTLYDSRLTLNELSIRPYPAAMSGSPPKNQEGAGQNIKLKFSKQQLTSQWVTSQWVATCTRHHQWQFPRSTALCQHWCQKHTFTKGFICRIHNQLIQPIFGEGLPIWFHHNIPLTPLVSP